MPFEFKGGTHIFGNTDAKNAEHKDENDGSSPFINRAFESSPFKVLPTSNHHFGLNSITTTPLTSSSASSAATAAFATPSFGVSSFFGTPPSFGRPAPLWSVPAKRKQDEVEPKKSLEMLKPGKEVSESSKQPGPTNVLNLALSRAITKQKAVMGDKPVGADQLLRLYGKHVEHQGGKLDAEALIEALHQMAASNSEASRFLNFIFERAATYQGGMIRSARNVKRQNQSMQALASKDDADKENEKPDDSEELRSRLRSVVHRELVDRGFEKASGFVVGLTENTQARVYTQIAMESKTQEQLLSGLKEEWLRDAKGREVEDFAHWLWDTVSELKKIVKEEGAVKKKRIALTGTGKTPVERSLSQIHEEKREKSRELSPLPISHDVVRKSDRYKNLGFKGYRGKYPQSEGTTCCNWIPEMTSDQLVNGHLYLHDEWLAMFKVWLRAKLEPSDGVDVDMAMDLVLSLLKSEVQETDLKAAFVEQLSDVFGSHTSSVVHHVFQGIARKEFINKDTMMVVRNLKAEAKPPTPFDGPIDPDQPFRFMDLPPELRTWVYRAALAPGEVRLCVCKHRAPLEVLTDSSPVASTTPALLAVSKQVHHEAKDIMYENTFIVDAVIGGTTRQLMPPKMIAAHALPQLKSLAVVVDLADYEKTCFKTIREMTGLKHVTLCGFQMKGRSAAGFHVRHWTSTLRSFLEYLPASCEVKVGPRTILQNQHRWTSKEMAGGDEKVEDVDGTLLERILETVLKDVERGRHNGVNADDAPRIAGRDTLFKYKGLPGGGYQTFFERI